MPMPRPPFPSAFLTCFITGFPSPSVFKSASDRVGSFGLPTNFATIPWWGTPPAMRSRVSRVSKRRGTEERMARLIASEMRRLRSPLTTSRRSKCRVPEASASRTGLIPQMRFMDS